MPKRQLKRTASKPNETTGIHEQAVKRIAIILNGISLRKEFFYSNILPRLSKVVKAEVYETRAREDAVLQASKLMYKGYDAIVAAGGDGTLNEVINGILREDEQSKSLPVAGLIPMGSGNDFARTMNIGTQADAIVKMFTRFESVEVDVGKISFRDKPTSSPRYFINIADAGMGPVVVQRMLDSGRPFGTNLAYYTAILRTFFGYKPVPVEVRTSLWKWKGNIRALAVANGKYFGSGIGIAPGAKPDDGIFTCFIAGNVSVLDFILQNNRLRRGKRAIHREIEYREAAEVEIYSTDPNALIEADGELVGSLPVKIELLHKRLRFLV